MISLTLILRKTKIAYEVKKGGVKINHLMFMDHLKLFAKNENQIDSLVKTVRVFSDNIKMGFTMKRGKIARSEGMPMPDGKTMMNIEENGYKYFGILQADDVKHDEMKDQIRKEYVKRIRKILKSKLNRGNIISAINSSAIAVVRYGGGIIKWTKMELEELDWKTRKLLTMYGAHHPKADVDRLYMKRADGGRGLIGVEDCVRMEVDSLEKYLSASNERVLKEVSQSGTIENKKKRKSKEDVKKEHTGKQEGKGLHGQFRKATENVKGEGSWDWLKKGYLKKETESTIIAAQDQALCTRNVRKNVYGEGTDSKC